MGVGYFSCSVCTEVICDAGDYGVCGNCESFLCMDCSKEAAILYGLDDVEGNALHCQNCSGDTVDYKELSEYLLTYANKGKNVEFDLENWWDEFRNSKENSD